MKYKYLAYTSKSLMLSVKDDIKLFYLYRYKGFPRCNILKNIENVI